MSFGEQGLPAAAAINDDSENIPSNHSGNRPFRDVLTAAASRRALLQGSLAAAAAGFLTPAALAGPQGAGRGRGGLVNFRELTIAEANVDRTMPSISADYEYQVLIPWGTPLSPGVVEYKGDPARRPTSAEAALQVGIGHDGIFYFPDDGPGRGKKIGRNSRAGVLCVNHEFGETPHVLGKPAPTSLEDVRVMQHVHGVSVVAIAEKFGTWNVVPSRFNRRIHVNTPVDFSGPAAASPLLQNPAGNPALGTVNNCGSGPTPWGTFLTCEENFNGYFGATGAFAATPEQARLGLNSTGFGYAWHFFDERFDLSNPGYVNEANRFGWVVEIDPFDPLQKPVKRTALGRFKHEAIAIGVAPDGRIAAYMGDDQTFDYCYKYISNRDWPSAIADGDSPLDDGKLYVARFNDDGTGDWLELTISNPLLAARFSSQADILINARIAGDILGATPMDRPEWAAIGLNDSVFWTMTNNSGRRTPNAANPQAPNPDGHIIRTVDDGGFLGLTFRWEIYILASSTRGTENVFSDPDAAYADPFGRLFIGTDGGQPDNIVEDQIVVFDTTQADPQPRRLLTGVAGDEVTGWAYTPDFRTAFTNIQHPGDGDPNLTSFPSPVKGFLIPRDATLVIRRKNNGVVGS